MRKAKHGLGAAAAGAVVLAVFSTLGDWIWVHYIPDGAVVPGIVHGVVLFLVLAAVLAWGAGTRRAAILLLTLLPMGGLVLAAAFYPLARLLGYLPALLSTWVAMWLLTAGLQRWARGKVETLGRTALRGIAAALGSGLAFWAISGIWTQPSPTGPDYPWHFACWTFAFLPGLLGLLLGQPEPPRTLS